MLNAKQSQFTFTLARFLLWLESKGYTVILGEAFRPADVAEIYAKQGRGISDSNHTLRLAIDLVIFKNIKPLDSFVEYQILGDEWKSLHPSARWGGDFTKLIDGKKLHAPDCAHFSFEHNGVQ